MSRSNFSEWSNSLSELLLTAYFGLKDLISKTKMENIITSKKFQFGLLMISYIIFFFYVLGNGQKLTTSDDSFAPLKPEIITLYKVIIVIHSLYFSYFLTQLLPSKYSGILNKMIVFLTSLLIISLVYFILYCCGDIGGT